MFQNFKADIIYYNTPTDFELEFNLCGCCRMRLLNDKCSDKKSLVLSLSRAASRSRVIIITAPLFSDDNITQTIASSIGSTTERLNNSAYNLNSDAEIDIIKNSTPLITDDGIFGGCIIESGPQSLILLTDNKSVRKTIMKTLIHPYIEEISAMEKAPTSPEEHDKDEIITTTEVEDEPAEPIYDTLQEALITEDDGGDENEDTELEIQEELITDIAPEEDDSAEEDGYYTSEYNDLYIETENTKNHDNKDENEADYGYYDNEYYIEETKPVYDSKFNLLMLIISIVLLIAVAVLCYCIFYVPTKAGVEPSVYLQEIFDTMFK